MATDRRLGAYSPAWKLAAPAGTEASPKEPADYEFTFVEIHLDAKGAGDSAKVKTLASAVRRLAGGQSR